MILEHTKNTSWLRKKSNPNLETVLVTDVGGTNTAVAVFDGKVQPFISAGFHSGKIENFTNFIREVLKYLLEKDSLSIKRLCIAAAGPISKNKKFCQLTNLNWSVDVDTIQRETGLDEVALINDFEAIAYGIDVIDQRNIVQIKGGALEKKSTRVLLGAGTGLGKSTLIFSETAGGYWPILSELGHANVSMSTKDDFHLAEFIQEKENREMVSWQDVLSGKGLRNIYQFLRSIKTVSSKHSAEIMNSDYDPALISKYKYEDELSYNSFKMFARYYARCAKIIAMDSLAFGGVYVAGGIAAKNVDIFIQEEFGFTREFLDVKKLRELLKSIPVYVIKDDDVGLYGAASFMKYHRDH